MSKHYTPAQIKFIKALRAKDYVWSFIATKFEDEYGVKVTDNALRFAVARQSNKPLNKNKTKPTEDNSRILVIPDMHHPYGHPDTVPFLKALSKKYKFTRVICMGDEIDHHAMSFHPSDPDLLSAGDELIAAIKDLEPLYELYPKMDLIDSNHGSMSYRKGKVNGVPRKYLRGYNEVLDAPSGWVWHMDLIVTLPNGSQVYFHHGLSNDVMKVVKQRGMSVCQGHFHSRFSIGYIGNPRDLIWGLQTGSLIDRDSMAFAYDRTNLERPIIGAAAIIDSLPRLFPMILNSDGRWNKIVP